MQKISQANLDEVLRLLAERLSLEQAPRLELVVCGGSALIALGLIRRSTRDVDVLGCYDSETGTTLDTRPLPQVLIRAADDVRVALQLPEAWLNSGPADQLKAGLPEGFNARLVKKEYGPALAVHFASRLDQIYFKLYAAADQGPGKHVADLQALHPIPEEILAASHWVLQQDDSEGFRPAFLEMLTQLGYGVLRERL